MSMIDSEAQDFTVRAYQDYEFRPVTKEDLKGKWSVFFFYPADFTFVCPTELQDLQNHYEAFKKISCEIYSISCDSVYVHKAWHDHSQAIGKVEFPMIGDPGQSSPAPLTSSPRTEKNPRELPSSSIPSARS